MTLDTVPSLATGSQPSPRGSPEIRLRPGTLEDCHSLAPRLRPEDVQEVWALCHQTPIQALEESFKASDLTYVVDYNGVGILMCGVGMVPGSPGVGCCWLLGTPEIRTVKLGFLRACRKHIEDFHKLYPVLWNLVDIRNTSHLKWLKWLGFEIIKHHPSIGYEQLPFVEVIRHAPENSPSRVD